MRPHTPRPFPWLSVLFLSFGLALLAAAGTVGVLWAFGKIDFPFLRRAEPVAQYMEGTVPIYLSVKPIPAYTRVSRDHLFQPDGSPKLFFLTPAEIEKRGFITDYNKILGRVMANEHRAGYGFREKDFLPEGTREGIAGGTPPGKRSLVLDATKVAGINALKAGDHFDLVASYLNELPKDDPKKRPAAIAVEGLPGQKKYAVSLVLVQDGVVVQGVTTRAAPKPNGAVAPNGTTPQVTLQEIVIAVEPAEVAAVTQALTGATEVRAVHRSGRPGEADRAQPTPGTLVKANRQVVIEVIRGGKVEFVTFPAPPAELPTLPAPRTAPPPPQRPYFLAGKSAGEEGP